MTNHRRAPRFLTDVYSSRQPSAFDVYHPTVGDYNGDGLDDIAGIRVWGGRFQMLLSDGVRFDTNIWDGGFPANPTKIEEVVSGPSSAAPAIPSLNSGPQINDSFFEDVEELAGLLGAL